MANYFSYFTEIEDRFQQRRGSILMLSTLDWALIETWREAGVPLEAVLRGIDQAFDRYEARALRAAGAKARLRKVNGLAWAAQSVMAAAMEAAEAAVGTGPVAPKPESGMEDERVAAYLERNAQLVAGAGQPELTLRLLELAGEVRVGTLSLEDLDRTLTVLEEKLQAALLAQASEAELVAWRAQADSELAPYRGKMQAVQIRQVQAQFLHKRLLESRGLPRLSLFYMSHG